MTRRFKRKGGRKFVMLDAYLLNSSAWNSLNVHAKVAYIELKRRYDGFNNGSIGLSCRELAATLNSSKDTAIRALDALAERGFIRKVRPSGFNIKNRRATEWRLTEYRCDVSGELPEKEFMRWMPEKKAQERHKDTQAHQKDSQPLKTA